MASGYSSRYSTRNNYSDKQSSPRPSAQRSRSPSENNDPNSQTRNVVQQFKNFIQEKLDNNDEINEKVIEMGISTIRRNLFREQCRISNWKRNLPEEVQYCPDDILIRSIAYGNNPNEVKTIIEDKMNQSDSPNISIAKLIGPLQNLKNALDKNPRINLLRAVRNFDDDEIERANRLFYSEGLHSLPGVTDYTYENAAEAVKGIRDCNVDSSDNSFLIGIMKVCRTAEDVRQSLEQDSINTSTRKTTSTIQSSPKNVRPSRNQTYSSSDEEQISSTRRPERR